MIPKPDIKAVLRKINPRETGLHERQLIHPYRDWIIGLFLSCLTLIAAGWWSAQTYIYNRDIDVEEDISIAGKVVYREQLVNQALLIHSERSEIFDQLLSQKAITVESITSEEISIATSTPSSNSELIQTASSTASTLEGLVSSSTESDVINNVPSGSSLIAPSL